ncbi:MAG: ATP-dependent helicase [Candidatus Paceibacterota bacterium]
MAHKYFLDKSESDSDIELDYEKQLNPEQQEVVFNGDGPCLVIAGPGSGKTRTLIYRLSYLLEQGVPERQILLMTFTKKAAEEMVKRTEELIGYEPTDLWAGTFHHVGNLVLRKHADKLGYEKDYTILDSQDSLQLVKTVIEDNDVGSEEYFPKAKLIKSVIDRTGNTGYSLKKTIDEYFSFIRDNAPEFERLLDKIKKIKSAYQSKKKGQNLMDYNDLLINWKTLLKQYPEVREKLDQRFKYVLVDEFQDTSPIQGDIIQLLSQDISNILVVGDDSQSIYSFRGATIDNIFDFKEEFDPKVFKLETNYRSTSSILKIANQSIENNEKKFEKELKAQKEQGVTPAVVPLENPEQQAEFIAQRALELKQEGLDLSDIGVLYRSHFHSTELEMELAQKGIPYIIRSGMKFHERKHIKDTLAFYRILLNPQEEISWRRLLEMQPGVGQVYAERLYSQIAQQDSLKQIARMRPKKVSNKAERGWKQLRSVFKEVISLWEESPDNYLKKIADTVLDEWYYSYLSASYENAEERLEDIEHLSLLLEKYDDIEKFLSDISLSESFSAQRSDGYQEGYEDSLVLSTVHQAKGLEWNTVFVIGLIDGWFPHWRSKESDLDLEEERRIFYVAVTRAKQQLYLTFPITAKSYRSGSNLTTISPFLQELDTTSYQEWQVERKSEEETEEIIEFD